jgi:uncharacterized protein YodC (DUF2158 family)
MFRVGDVVRLNRGWTPMIVLDIEDDGSVLAKYASNPSYPVCRWDYENPRDACHYDRHYSGYTAWDGRPISKEHLTMPRRYRTISGPKEVGTYLNTTTAGAFVLELDGGRVATFDPRDLEEDIPDTFRVKAMANNYSCHYEMPEGVTIGRGDILVSDSANIYVVVETNTKNRNPKGVFKGSRLVKEEL